MQETQAVLDADAEQPRALGYSSRFDRTMSKRANFALGFTYLSPVVGVYTLFATAFASGGPPYVWSYLIVGVGQPLVCLVFGEVVSQFPISGGPYPWGEGSLASAGRGWRAGCTPVHSV
jgi:amino acid transporter